MASNVAEIIVRARDETKNVLGNIGAGVVALNAGLEVVGKAFDAVGRVVGFAIDQAKVLVEAAAEQQAAEELRSTALALTGQLTEANVKASDELATALQRLTGVGDEANLMVQQQLLIIGQLSVEELPRATQLTLDWAKVTGKDATNAALDIAKALSGNVAMLQRYGIAINKSEVDTRGSVVVFEALERQIGGASLQTLQTFTGASEALDGALNDVRQTLGKSITNSAALNRVMNLLSNTLIDISGTDVGVVLGDAIAKGASLAGFAITAMLETLTNLLKAFAVVADVTQPFSDTGDKVRALADRMEKASETASDLALRLLLASTATGEFKIVIDEQAQALKKLAKEEQEAAEQAKILAEAQAELAAKVRTANKSLFDFIQKVGAALIVDQQERLEEQAFLDSVAVNDSIASRGLKAAAIAAIEAKLHQDLEILRLEADQKKKDEDQLALEEWEAVQQRKLDILQSNVTAKLAFEKEGQDKEKALVTANAKHIGAVGAELLAAGMQGKEEAFQAIKSLLAREAAAGIATAILSPTSGIPFPVNLILAPIAAAAAIALIQSFHTGGMIPKAAHGMVMGQDERLVRAEVGEGIITAQGIQRIGGPGMLGAVNAGTAGGAGAGIVVNIQAHDAASVEASFSEGGDMNRAFKRARSRGDI